MLENYKIKAKRDYNKKNSNK